MIKHPNSKITKGIIFAGCSFTWGQGLYYYSNLETLQEPPPNYFYEHYVTPAHYDFMKSVRYPRIVANRFSTFELVQPWNGGSNERIIAWWRSCLELPNARPDGQTPKYKPSEISHLVFQLTQWPRNPITVNHPGIKSETSHSDFMSTHSHLFTAWLQENNLSVEQYVESAITDNLQMVKDFLIELENLGIKTYICTWPYEFINRIHADPWLRERFISFEYSSNTYDSIEDMMQAHPELEIRRDTSSFEDTPKDHHPSLKCHQVMAQNVIKHLEKDLV